jgi:hypothetical protein
MTKPDADDLDAAEAAAYRALGSGDAPPAGLEDRVVGALRARGLLRSRALRGRAWAAWLAACAACLVIGFAVGRRGEPAPHGPRFVLLLEEPDARVVGAGEEAQRVNEYSAWARAEHSAGRLLAGEKLEDAEVRLAGENTTTSAQSADGPRGYFIVTAPSLEVALEIARSCPHLRHGGRITVRRIADLS